MQITNFKKIGRKKLLPNIKKGRTDDVMKTLSYT